MFSSVSITLISLIIHTLSYTLVYNLFTLCNLFNTVYKTNMSRLASFSFQIDIMAKFDPASASFF